MYQALYRKYRPGVFSDVIGQPQVTRVLAGEVSAGRLSHAYLFTGSRGTGKTSCARIFAKAVNCPNAHHGDGCGECEICKGIDNGSLLDYSEMDAAGNRGIEDIRAIRDRAYMTPAVAKYRFFVLDEVHMLTKEAFNALLKILEEPPAHVIFILATTDSQKVPDTIRSRCQRFDFMRIEPDLIAERLISIASKEGHVLTEDGAALLAGMADGAMRDALSLLDRCIGEAETITAETVSAVTGLIGRDSLFALSDAFTSSDVGRTLIVVDSFFRASCDAERLCGDLLEHLRSFMIVKMTASPGEILSCTKGDLEKYRLRADPLPIEKILYWLDILTETAEKLKWSVNGRADIETALVRLCLPSTANSKDAILTRLSDLEAQVRALKARPISAVKEEKSTAPVDNENPPFEGSEEELSLPFDEPEDDAPLPFDELEDDAMPPFDEPEDDAMPPFDEPEDDAPLPFDEPEDDAPLPFEEEDDEPMPPPVETNTAKKTADANQPFPYWQQICVEAKRLSPPLNGLIDGSAAKENGDTLIIDSINPLFKAIVQKNQAMIQVIKTAITNITGKEYQIKFV